MDTTDPAPTLEAEEPAATAVASAPDDEPGLDDDRCPSCDTPGAWRLTWRHRVSPFGAVTALVLAFWLGLAGWLLGFGLMPAGVLAGFGVFLLLLRRRAEICEACGYVRPR